MFWVSDFVTLYVSQFNFKYLTPHALTKTPTFAPKMGVPMPLIFFGIPAVHIIVDPRLCVPGLPQVYSYRKLFCLLWKK